MKAKKSFGQHYLRDHGVVDKILAAANVGKTDLVIEVGPGEGALTEGLSQATKNLILIEADRDLIEPLKEHFPKAEIISADAANVDYSKFTDKREWIFVSNLPYNSGNAILRQVLSTSNPPQYLVVMLQKEVGDKLLAKPGDMSLLSVAVQVYAKVEKVCKVMPGSFTPPPKVESVVLKLVPRVLADTPEQVIAVAKAGFAKKRKQLHKNLSEAGLGTSPVIKTWLKERGLSELARAEELSVADWVELAEKLGTS